MSMPHSIVILTDSTCDIPQPLIDQYAIAVLPHVLIWDQQAYRDRIDLQPADFYHRLRTEKELPTTAQASVMSFSDAFEQARASGAEAVVAILLNSKFSGALQSARHAAETARLPVHIHDSRNVTMGLGWQVLAAARARDAGGGVEDILAAACRVRDRVQLYICLDTLEYVARGGRIGNASRMLGAMLNIKPVIFVDPHTGTVEPAGMAVTRHKAVDLLYRKFFNLLDGQQNMHIAVLHGDAAGEAAALYERVFREKVPAEMLTNITGPVLGINTGPQTLALCGYGE